MNRTDQTLVEQMKISDVEIALRKDLLNLTSQDIKALTTHKLLMDENIDSIVEIFYV